jgi:hypothetical protein
MPSIGSWLTKHEGGHSQISEQRWRLYCANCAAYLKFRIGWHISRAWPRRLDLTAGGGARSLREDDRRSLANYRERNCLQRGQWNRRPWAQGATMTRRSKATPSRTTAVVRPGARRSSVTCGVPEGAGDRRRRDGCGVDGIVFLTDRPLPSHRLYGLVSSGCPAARNH